MIFTVGSALRFGWETFKKRPWLFVAATVVMGLVELLLEFFSGAIAVLFANSDQELAIAFLGTYFSLGAVFGTLAAMGWVALFLAAHDNPETVKLSALWHPRPFWKFLGAGFLLLLVLAAGPLLALLLMFVNVPLGAIAMIVAVVAATILSLVFMFSNTIVIDRELGPIEAMRESNRITRGHRWRLFGLTLVFMLIGLLYHLFDKVLFGAPLPLNVLGALATVAALLVLWPVLALADIRAYRVLSAAAPADATLASKAAAPK